MLAWSRFAVCSLLLGTLLAQDDDGDPRLASAIRQIFRSRGEPPIRDGAQTCLRVGDAKAMSILLKVLDGPNPHMRDIVWEVMPDFTDPYARRRVADELKTNRANAGVRHWCAELLGMYGDADWLPFLTTALRDKDVDVVRAAARSLGMLKRTEAVKPLQPFVKHKDPRVRANAIEALARIDGAGFTPLLRAEIAGADDGGVRCALLGAAAEILPGDVEALSRAAQSDEDWRPRMQAIDNLARLETRGAIEGLIAGLQDGRPAVRARALRSLQSTTGQRFGKHVEWTTWWQENADTFAFGKGGAAVQAPASGQETVASFHGVRIESDHCIFLLDRTPSMEQTLVSAGKSKQEAAVEELEATLTRMIGSDLAFNVAVYNEELDVAGKKAVPLDKKRLAAAVRFVRAAKPEGAKNIWHALTSVVADPSVDTVILLSSGEPEVGEYVHWNRVTRHLADLNRFHKIVVHTVAYSNVEWYLEQLRHIAEVTGGTCKEVN